MMSPLHLARLEGNLDGLSNLGGLAGRSYGGQRIGGQTFESRSVFSQDPRKLGFDSRTLALPYASVNTPGQTLALPSSSDIAAQHLTPGQRMLLAGAAAEAGVDVPSTSAVSFDVPGVDVETPGKGKEIVAPGMEIETPGVDLQTPAVKLLKPNSRSFLCRRVKASGLGLSVSARRPRRACQRPRSASYTIPSSATPKKPRAKFTRCQVQLRCKRRWGISA